MFRSSLQIKILTMKFPIFYFKILKPRFLQITKIYFFLPRVAKTQFHILLTIIYFYCFSYTKIPKSELRVCWLRFWIKRVIKDTSDAKTNLWICRAWCCNSFRHKFAKASSTAPSSTLFAVARRMFEVMKRMSSLAQEKLIAHNVTQLSWPSEVSYCSFFDALRGRAWYAKK